jgi:hypothetical protein
MTAVWWLGEGEWEGRRGQIGGEDRALEGTRVDWCEVVGWKGSSLDYVISAGR